MRDQTRLGENAQHCSCFLSPCHSTAWFRSFRAGEGSTTKKDTAVDHAIVLFRYINNKDVFEACYSRDLAKRLLLNTTTSTELELLIVQRLKVECGNMYVGGTRCSSSNARQFCCQGRPLNPHHCCDAMQCHRYTAKMEGMFNDMRKAETLNQQFTYWSSQRRAQTLAGPTALSEVCWDVVVLMVASVFHSASHALGSLLLQKPRPHGPAFSVRVLTAGVWPSFPKSPPTLRLPPVRVSVVFVPCCRPQRCQIFRAATLMFCGCWSQELADLREQFRQYYLRQSKTRILDFLPVSANLNTFTPLLFQSLSMLVLHR